MYLRLLIAAFIVSSTPVVSLGVDCADVVDLYLQPLVQGATDVQQMSISYTAVQWRDFDLQCGPNALPILAERYRSSEDLKEKDMLATCIYVVSGLTMARSSGSTTANRELARSISGATWTPLLLENASAERGVQQHIEKMDSILAWWENYSQTQVDDMVRRNLRLLHRRLQADATLQKRQLLDRIFCAEGVAIHSVGIFSIPELINDLGKTGTPEVFCLFLSRCGESQDYISYYKGNGEKWPTLEEKADYIRTWWQKRRPTYTELGDLLAKIDEAVARLPSSN